MLLTYHRRPLLEVVETADAVVARLLRPTVLDDAAVEPLRRELLDALHQAGARTLVLNCTAVEHFGSAWVGNLIGLHKRMAAQGRRLVLSNLPPLLWTALARLRLTTYLEICGDESEALGQAEPTLCWESA
jgi:anti-anti-sigma factor